MRSSFRLAAVTAFALAAVQLGTTRTASSQASAPSSNVAKTLAHLAANDEYKGFRVGVEVVEVETGRVLAAAGEHQPLNPASNEKIVTTLAVLSLLHPEHRFETGLYGSSSKGPVLSGAITLRGYGDPSLRVGD